MWPNKMFVVGNPFQSGLIKTILRAIYTCKVPETIAKTFYSYLVIIA